jgi:hypothetical protein
MSLTYQYELAACYKNMSHPTMLAASMAHQSSDHEGVFQKNVLVNTAPAPIVLSIFPQKPVIKMCPFVITIFNCLNLSNMKYHVAIDITFFSHTPCHCGQNLCLLSM